jgi:prepilin-type processing-associated H-X9-DG protein
MKVSKGVRIAREPVLSGFSIWGLLGILAAAVFLIIIVLLPSAMTGSHSRKASRVVCMTQLKQISLAMLVWAEENKMDFPMHVSFTNGGSKELTARGWVAPTFWAISNQLQTPTAVTCPDDKKRLPRADAFSSLTDRKISYFIHLDATLHEQKQDWVLLGDRHVATNGVALPAGIDGVALPAGIVQIHDPQTVSWTTNIHQGQGNVALADGGVHQVNSKRFRDVLKPITTVPHTLVMP